MIKWALLSGPTRYYLWTYPEMLVADPEMIKQITVKYFDKFTDRQQVMGFGGIELQGKIYYGLLFLLGQKWKQSRHILTPAFTTSKIKLVSVHASVCVYTVHNNTIALTTTVLSVPLCGRWSLW